MIDLFRVQIADLILILSLSAVGILAACIFVAIVTFIFVHLFKFVRWVKRGNRP